MKTITKITALFILLVQIPSISLAGEVQEEKASKPTTEKETKKPLNAWVDCGIGAMVFDNTAWAAISSNILWDFGSTAVTSNQSSQNTCNSKKAQMAMYVGATYANLEEETVKGNGQHVNAMLNIMGCDSTVHNQIIASIRTDFRTTLQNAEYATQAKVTKAENYYNLVQKNIDTQFSKQCQAI
ncbi:hypothetical protein MNBD_GAMMA22-181 [hydrothermal vent metagenome]|uniref:DUF3015 domain-containing protein n=1 Tax=hydrothermal vent metagenome TaxID=652676 RepID=A0A3B1API1_9ZZZZ